MCVNTAPIIARRPSSRFAIPPDHGALTLVKVTSAKVQRYVGGPPHVAKPTVD